MLSNGISVTRVIEHYILKKEMNANKTLTIPGRLKGLEHITTPLMTRLLHFLKQHIRYPNIDSQIR